MKSALSSTFSHVLRTGLSTALVVSSFASTALADAFDQLPLHFMAPTSKWAPSSDQGMVRLHSNGKAGLRIFGYGSSHSERLRSAKDLAARGVVQDGDVLLTFRPGWDGKANYTDIQLGISHTAIVYIDDAGLIQTVEAPMSYNSPLTSSEHYTDRSMPVDALHIIRPNLDAQQRANVRAWLKKLSQTGPSRVSFNGDYSAPTHGVIGDALITQLGQIANGGRNKLSLYCSEFVWAVLGLRDCKDGNLNGCASPIFPLMPALGVNGRSGLVDGPDAILRSVNLGDAYRLDYLANEVMAPKDTKCDKRVMSQGHCDVSNSFTPLVPTLGQYYATGSNPAMAQGINASAGVPVPNYTPTSFFIKAVEPNNQFGYIGTIYYKR